MNVDPFVLGVAGPVKFRFERCTDEPNMVVGGGVDQVPEFLLRGPGFGAGWFHGGHDIRELV